MLLRKIAISSLAAALCAAFPASALATNGLYLIGYGSESTLMGGADVAVARDAFAASNNPSGMTQLSAKTFEADLVGFTFSENSHSDTLGNNKKNIVNGNSGFINLAYAQPVADSPFAAGVSLVAQGGMGWVYRGLNSIFGRDDASSTFTIAKLSPALAWKVNNRLSLGANIGFNYVAINQELFPNVSTTTPIPFAGFRFKNASGSGINAKFGLQYRPAEDVVVGLTYGIPTSVPMKNGSLRINYSDPAFGGLGVVRYDNARLDGVHMPEEWALGVSYRPAPSLLLSLQGKWYGWADALKTLTITATEPRNPLAPPVVTIANNVAWNNQRVYALGLAYDYSPETRVLAGFNYGLRPMPDQNLNPLFQPILQRRYTLGLNRKLGAEWDVAAGIEWHPLVCATYNNPLFGGNSSARIENLMMHLAFKRHW